MCYGYDLSQAESVTVLDTNDDKLNWIFMAFDQDGGGFIDVHEIRDIVTCLFRSVLNDSGLVIFDPPQVC